MKENQRKFNIYIFLSSFARNLIEVFIPIILYKFGYSIKEVIYYFLLANVFSLLLTYPCILMSKKFDNKILSFIGIGAFIILQIMLNSISSSIIYISFLALLYALYRRCYWIARRFYNLKVIHKKDIASTYSIISIVNQLSVVFSAYIGSLLLDFVSLNVLTFISILLFIISIIPLYLMKFEHEKNDIKLDFIGTFKKIPKSNLYLFGSYELLNVIKFLFPLYIFIYIKNTYQVVGLLNLFCNLATILFTYAYGKQINTNKNFLKQSIFVVVIIYILKANCTTSLLIIISFLEGISTKMHELSISKEFYSLSKKFEYSNYNLIYEFMQNLFRTVVVLILYIFTNDLKTMIYITLVFILIGTFLKFKKIDADDFDI